MGLNRSIMFNKSKIIKKGDEKVTELDEDIGKSLTMLEQKGDVSLRGIFLNSTECVKFKMADASENQYLLVRIPFRSPVHPQGRLRIRKAQPPPTAHHRPDERE